GQAYAGVQRGDRRVVPRFDVTEEDLGGGDAVQFQPRVEARNVVGDHDPAENRGQLDIRTRERLDLVGLQRCVRGAEVHGLGGELLDPAPRADRLVVDLRARLDLLEVLEPLLVDRIGEGRARAGQCVALEPPARGGAGAAAGI